MNETLTILVLDDEPYAELLLKRSTRRSKYQIKFVFAHDDRTLVSAATTALASGAIDLALCDNRVPPFFDYRESTPILRASGYDKHIVVFSGWRGDSCFEEFDRHDVSEVVDRDQLTSEGIDRLIETYCDRAPRCLKAVGARGDAGHGGGGASPRERAFAPGSRGLDGRRPKLH